MRAFKYHFQLSIGFLIRSFSISALHFVFFEFGFNKRYSLRIRFRKFIVKPVGIDFNPQEYLIFIPDF